MGRWRPPSPRGSVYITAEGVQAMEKELHRLWKVERPKVTQVVHEAAKNGDRSENGDYIYGKRRLREIDSRVRYLSKRLEEVKVVESVPDNQQQIYFGAYVTLEDDSGSESVYRIVGSDEFDLREHKLSVDSPLARAMLGKSVDDEVTFNSPEGIKQYYVTAVHYAPGLKPR